MARILCVVLSILEIGVAAVLSAPTESCSCGKNKISNHTRPKVIRGQDADLNEYPWMVLVHGCGGAVINSKFILTARHCTKGEDEKYVMALGEWDIHNELDTETRKDFKVVNIVRHPGEHIDLALIEVEGDIDLSIYTPICLPKPGFDVRGKRVTLAGWGDQCGRDSGVDCFDRERSFILQEADMPVPSNAECRQDRPEIICFGGEEGKAACYGDSGSPIIYNDNGKWTVVTLVSDWGPGSGVCNGEPGNFQQGPEITKFLDWIEDNTKGGTSCKD